MMNIARHFVWLLLPVWAPLCLAAQKPNILLFMAEDIGTDLPSYGARGLQMPNLDALAKGGTRYNRFYTNSPICSPSRTSLMTGMYQTSMGGHNHRDKTNTLPDGVRPLTHYLREAGYALRLGSDLVYDKGKKLDLNFKARGQGRLFDKKVDKNKPFFWQIQLKMTHRATDDRWQQVRSLSKDPVLPEAVDLPPYLPDHPQVRLDWANYYDTLEYIDSEVGLVLEELKRAGQLDNTLVIFMGDNGRAQVRGKSYLWEDGIHVPLIVKGAGVPAGKVVDDLLSGIDLTATLLQIAGVSPPAHMQGQAFLFNRHYRPKDAVFAARDRHDEVVDVSRAVVGRRYKYIHNFMPQVPWDARMAYYDIPRVRPILPLLRQLHTEGKLTAAQAYFFSPTKPREQLYDLERDPWELNNLADSPQHRKIKTGLREKLFRWIEQSNDQGLAKTAGGEWRPAIKPFDVCGIKAAAGKSRKCKPPVSVTINPNSEQWRISSTLLGLHTRYDIESDAAYRDGELARWARRIGVGTMRFPGGTIVKYWDWRQPSGHIRVDPWSPDYQGPVSPPENWMSLDEYLRFVDLSGIRPMLGVNYRSGYAYDRIDDSVERAADMVRYVKGRGHPGAYYYIGNEDMHMVGGLESAARLFVRHARAMKAVDPAIKIFWNDNNVNTERLRTYLSIAGDWADGLEFHGKWPYGGEGDGSVGTFAQWQAQVPLVDRRRQRAWRDLAIKFRAVAAKAGYPDLLIAQNEYGFGKRLEGFNRYTYGLLIVDFMQEFFIGGYDIAGFWNNIRLDSPLQAMGLLSPKHGYRKNPMHLGFELMAPAQGATMIGYSSDHKQVYGFAAKTDEAILLMLINKTGREQALRVRFDGQAPALERPPRALAMVNSTDHWGQTVPVAVNYSSRSGAFSGVLPPLSYTRIVFPGAK